MGIPDYGIRLRQLANHLPNGAIEYSGGNALLNLNVLVGEGGLSAESPAVTTAIVRLIIAARKAQNDYGQDPATVGLPSYSFPPPKIENSKGRQFENSFEGRATFSVVCRLQNSFTSVGDIVGGSESSAF